MGVAPRANGGDTDLSKMATSATGTVEFKVSGQWRYQMSAWISSKTKDEIVVTACMSQMLDTQDITNARKYVTIKIHK